MLCLLLRYTLLKVTTTTFLKQRYNPSGGTLKLIYIFHVLSGGKELAEDTQNQIETAELVLKQLRSSVLDQIAITLQAVSSLQQLYRAQKSALLENSSNSSGNAASVLTRKNSTSECLDLLSTVEDGVVRYFLCCCYADFLSFPSPFLWVMVVLPVPSPID